MASGRVDDPLSGLSAGFVAQADRASEGPSLIGAADDADLQYLSAEETRDWAVWGAIMGSDTTVDGADGIPGWDATAGGLAFGVESHAWTAFGAPITAGLAAGYISTDVDSGSSDSQIDSWHVGLYAAARTGRLTLSGAAAYAHYQFDFDRLVAFGGGSSVADGDAGGHSVTGSFDAFYDLSDPEQAGFRFGPVGTLDIAYVHRGDFSETGAGILNLTVGSDNAAQVVTGLGAAIGVNEEIGGAAIAFDARLQWEHVFVDNRVTTASTIPLASATFQTPSASVDRDRLAVGVGAAIEFSDTIAAHVRYDGAFGANTRGHNGSAGLTIRF